MSGAEDEVPRVASRTADEHKPGVQVASGSTSVQAARAMESTLSPIVGADEFGCDPRQPTFASSDLRQRDDQRQRYQQQIDEQLLLEVARDSRGSIRRSHHRYSRSRYHRHSRSDSRRSRHQGRRDRSRSRNRDSRHNHRRCSRSGSGNSERNQLERSVLFVESRITTERRKYEAERVKETQIVQWNKENNLTGLNFHHWQKAIRNHLKIVKLWAIVNGTEPKPYDPDDARLWINLDRIAVNHLTNAVNSSLIIGINDENSANEIWKTISRNHNNVNWGTGGLLFAQLSNLKCTESGSLEEHLKKFKEITKKLADLGEPVSDKQKAALLLDSMSDSWNNFAAIYWSATVGPSFVELESSILAYQKRRTTGHDARRKEEQRTANAAAAHHVEQQLHDEQGLAQRVAALETKLVNMVKAIASFTKKVIPRSSGMTTCWMKEKHTAELARRNPKRIEANNSTAEGPVDKEDEIDENDNPGESDVSWGAAVVVNQVGEGQMDDSGNDHELEWIIDSGATHHICFVKSMFSALKPTSMTVNLPNNTQVRASGVGTVKLVVRCSSSPSKQELVLKQVTFPLSKAPSFHCNEKYILIFVDRYSRYIHVHILNEKSETGKVIVEHRAQIESKHNRPLANLHTDKGGEYLGGQVAAFCRREGIYHSTTITMTSQQNGFAEVRFRDILARARAMLIEADLPKQLWSYAVECAVYCMNRSVSANSNTTPFKL
ncbi:hypothetical protein AeMF1_013327 [Aphanomyces euteiches]|nr:hypothetical protein AeMF1_013327 [Aphanomyces euteiches]